MEANRLVFTPTTKAALGPPRRKAGPHYKNVIPKLTTYLQEHPNRVLHINEVTAAVGLDYTTVSGSLARMARGRLPLERVGAGLYRWRTNEAPMPEVEEEDDTVEVAAGFELIAMLPDGRPLLMGQDGYTYGTERVVVRRVRRIGPA